MYARLVSYTKENSIFIKTFGFLWQRLQGSIMKSLPLLLCMLTGCGVYTKENMSNLPHQFQLANHHFACPVAVINPVVRPTTPDPRFGSIVGGVVGGSVGVTLGMLVGIFVGAVTSLDNDFAGMVSSVSGGFLGGILGMVAGLHAFRLHSVATVPDPMFRQSFI